MSNLSRRSLVSSAAVLPALAVPALASFSPDHPDAELLRLAVQLEVVGRPVEVENELGRKRGDEWRAACERAGLPLIAWFDWPGGEAKMDEWREYEDKRMALYPPHDEEKDENGQTKMDRLIGRLHLITEEILSFRPTTLDGLRVQARALVLATDDLFNVDTTSTYAPEQDFAESVFALLGLGQDGKPSARLDGARGIKRHA